MPRYSVAVPVFSTTFYKCTAASPEEALRKAQEKCCPPTVCCQCSADIQVEEIDSDNLTIDCVEEITR